MESMRSMGTACVAHASASLDVCEARDPKGLYAKARSGSLPGFTGIDAPYDLPANADISVDLGLIGVEQAREIIEAWIERATGRAA